MKHLSRREQVVFIINVSLAITVIIGILWAILYQQQRENCWSKYQFEQEAIQNCEVKP